MATKEAPKVVCISSEIGSGITERECLQIFAGLVGSLILISGGDARKVKKAIQTLLLDEVWDDILLRMEKAGLV